MRSQAEIIQNILEEHDSFSVVTGSDNVTVFCRACDSSMGTFPIQSGEAVLTTMQAGRTLLREHQTALIDQALKKAEIADTRMDVLRSVATSRSGLAAAANVMAGDNRDSLSDKKRHKIDKQAIEIISAYLLAPMDTGHFDFDDGDPAYEAVINKVQELLDRGLKDADMIVSLASTELARVANIQPTQTHLLRCALREAEEATAERERFRAALISAEADQHPCAALHTRIGELRRRVGERHGFVLVACTRCDTDMIAQEDGNEVSNEAMETCSRCTAEILAAS